MITTDALEQIEITSDTALWEWLGRHCEQDDSVWLVTYKAHARNRYLSREAVLDALVAHGWIDGVRRKLDRDRTMQLIGPRRTRAWAKTYCDRAERLIAEGRMHPAGLAGVNRAKAEGQWRSMADVDALILPEDFRAALAADGAQIWWDNAAPSYRRNVLRWIAIAKKPDTRAARILAAAQASARGEKLPQM